jgi:hypothetical protein
MKVVRRWSDWALALAICVISRVTAAQTPDAGVGLLHCDPGAWIHSIDGDIKQHAKNLDGKDCQLSLTPGDHFLVTHYQWSTPGGIFSSGTYVSGGTLRVDFHVVAGHVYRLKYRPGLAIHRGKDWHAWVEDVTSAESGLPSTGPTVNKSRKKVPKSERKTFVILRLSPPNTRVATMRGRASGIWFMKSFQLKEPWFEAEGDQEFAMNAVNIGDNLALDWMMPLNTLSTSGPDNSGIVCGDTLTPVFEDLPGGKALYLGEVTFSPSPRGVTMTFAQNDLEEARLFLNREHPELSDKLELAPVRRLRVTRPCFEEESIEIVSAPPGGWPRNRLSSGDARE